MAQQIDIVANLLMKVDGAEAGINKLKNSLSKLKMPEGLENSFKKSFANLDVIFARYRSQVEKGFNTKADVTNFAKTGKALDAELDRISKHFTELTGKQVDFKINSAEITKTEEELTKLIAQRNELAKSSVKFEITGAKEGYKDIESLLTKLKEAAGNTKTGQYASGALDFLKQGDLQSALVLLDKASVSCKRFSDEKQKAFANDTGFNMSTAIQKIVEELTGAEGKFGNVNAEVTKLEQILADLRTGQIKDAGDLAKRLADDMLNVGTAAKQADDAMQDFARSSFNMTQQLGQLQQSTQYFFSLRNMINLLKRGLDDAIQSVKELDKAMTETAVVTEFDVSDMWAKLPEYTTNANALGATIQDMYESTTLYYQQGLNTQQAMEIATETMKMARIAGLEAKDATDMMTAALRGFNMELDEASATRINDVYSNLAAKTASDTKEIGTAMQRTASIAHSAGMSFEGTAAFLAQAIETTREPAENLGTAMKTIVARFTELKKNPLEIVEVDGEEVSYNKVDTALQSIGVSLKDANGQFRALDEVFLDISKKWDGLSQTQQRYVATMAAGSRQQSRFIAMMSDYGRTVELMSYANDSAGASQEQFNKTMESFEAKIHQLQNAWQRFTMGIANEKFIKGAVDGLTNVLTIVNNIIDKISGGNGLVKSLLSVATAFMGLKTGGRIINKLIGGLGGLVDPTSNFFSGFKGGAIKQGKDGVTQAKAISDPIVQAINRIYGVLNKSKVEGSKLSSGSFQDYSNKQTGFRKSASEGASVGQIFGNLEGLDKKQISTILNNNPGIEMQLQRTANQYIKGLNLDKGVQDLVSKSIPSMFKAFKNDPQMSPESFVKAFRPDQIGKSLIKAGEPAGKQLIQGYANDYKQFFAQRQQDWAKQQQDFYGRQITPESHKQLLQSNKQYQNEYNQYSKRGVELFNNKYLSSSPILEPTKLEKAAQGVGAIGSAFGTAGMAVSSFGNALSSLGLEKVGSLFTNLGNKIASVGSMISSVAMTMNQIQLAGGISAITSAAWFAPLMTVMGAIAATGLLVGGSILIANNQMQKIKDSAEEVTKTFQETNEQTQDNIAALKQYQTQAATWAKSVDVNGNNISLSDDEYNQYLEAVDKIAELNPEIVQGYNAQGHAIIEINSALKETLALQEKNRQQTLKTYTDQTSLEKLLSARNISKDYYKNAEFTSEEKLSRSQLGQIQKTYAGDLSMGIHADSSIKKQLIPLKKQTQEVAKELQKSDLFKKDKANTKALLEGYGIDFDALLNGEKDAVNRFVENQDAIQSKLSAAAENLGVDFKDSFNKSFSTLGEDTAAFEESIEPIYQYLATKTSNTDAFKNIAPEFQSAVMAGLKDIAKEDMGANEMIKASEALVKEFDNLTAEGSKYATAMNQVEQAQDKFAQSLDAAEYAKGTEDALATLNNLMEQYAGKTDAYSQAIAEYLQNQIDRIKNFTEEGAISLSEALNTATNEIAAAEGAYDSFKEATKSDFATGAESMKSIFDEVTKETDGIALHMQGKGDKTFWTGAESLFGADALVDKTSEQVKKMFDRIQPMLQEGQAGFDAFWTDVFSNENVEKLKNIEGVEIDPENWMLNWDDNVNPEVFHEMAQALGMSDEFLTSMLNKGRQFGAIDFMDTNDVRKALSTDAAAIAGATTTTVQGKNGPEQVADMFVKGDYLRSALQDAGMVTPQDQQEAIDRLASEGVHIIKDPDQISTNDLKGMGITDMASAIKILGDTGQFTKDEIQAYAEKLGDYTPEDFADGYQQYLDAQEHPEIEPIQSIESTVQQIASLLATQQVQEGHLADTHVSEDFKRAIYGEANKRDTQAQLFSQGKNEQGNIMTAQQYQFNLAELQKAQVEAQNYINTLTSGMKNASGQDLENMKAEKASMEATLSYLNDQINQGRQNWAEAYAQQQYDMAYQSALDAGANVKTAQEEANTVKQDALKQAQELIQATQEGLTDGLNTTDTSEIKDAATESAKKYTDTGTGSTANITSSTITKGVEFVTKGVEEATKDIDTVDSKADEGATHTTEFKTSGEKEAEGAIKKMTDADTGSKTVKVGASVDTSGAQKAASAIGGMSAKIGVGIKDNATAAAEKVRKGIDSKSASIDIKPNYTGNWTKTVTVREQKAATGVNNKIETHHVPVFGSLAKGTKKGKLGPRNQGGITLTGEEGYEIAWLPSEGRSMILGANGPQMINLPSDATVYNHEQSVDILRKRQTINAGSLPTGNASYVPPGGGSKSPSKSPKKNKKDKNNDDKKNKKDKEKTKILYEQWKVDTLIYNTEKKIAQVTRTITKLQKQFSKELDKTGISLQTIGKLGDQRNAQIQKSIQLNQVLVDKYKQQFKELTDGTEQLDISWSEKTLVTKTTGSGKKKKTTTSEGSQSFNEKMSVGQFISYDPDTGAYTLNESALQNAFGNDKNKGEAVRKAVESKIDEYTNGLNKAEDEMESLREQYEEMIRQITDKFYSWQTILTKVYNITSKIEEVEARQARKESQTSLYDTRLLAGLEKNSVEFRKLTYDTFKSTLDGAVDLINKNREKVIASAQELSEKVTGQDLLKRIQLINQQLDAITEAQSAANTLNNLKSQKATAEAQITAGNQASANLYNLYYDYYSKQYAKENLQSILNGIYVQVSEDATDMANAKRKHGSSSKAYKNAKANYKDTVALAREYEGHVYNASVAEQNALNAVNNALTAISQATIAQANLPQILTNLANAQAEYDKAAAKVAAMSGDGQIDSIKAALELSKKDLETQYTNLQRMQNYLEITQNEDGTLDINILTEKFEQDKYVGKEGIDDKFKDELEKFVDELKTGSQNISDTINTIQSQLTDLTQQLIDLKEAYASYADDLLDSYNDLKDKEIDALKNMSSSITNAFKDLFDKVKQNLDERRRIEDNAKTETDISKKQQQLAVLRANSAGGNQVQIKQLEKEIADSQQSYQRTLEDQLLDRLQQSNDNAEKQREKLIELTSAIYDLQKSNGINADYIDMLLANPEKYQTEITELWKQSQEYSQKSHQRQELLNSKLDKMMIDLNPETGLPEQIISTKAALSGLNVILEQVKNGFNDILKLATEPQNTVTENTAEQENNAQKIVSNDKKSSQLYASYKRRYENNISKFAATVDPNNIDINQFASILRIGRKINKSPTTILRDLLQRFKGSSEAEALLQQQLLSIIKTHKYATGGLANYTGPAWLDGTPSKPELVLNSTDTKNFLALRDVLSSAMKSTGSVNNSYGGDATYEININVDKLTSDYDVDKVAERVKKIIVKDSSYRNVTQVRNLR